jgi:hypothetical protein
MTKNLQPTSFTKEILDIIRTRIPISSVVQQHHSLKKIGLPPDIIFKLP